MERRINIDVSGMPQSLQLLLCGRCHFPVPTNVRNQIKTMWVTIKHELVRTLRVAVAHTDSSHASKQIQITPPIHIPQPLHVSLVDKHWLLIIGDLHGHGVAVLPADLHHPLFWHTLETKTNTGNTMQENPFYMCLVWLNIYIYYWGNYKAQRRIQTLSAFWMLLLLLLLPCIILV